MQIDFHYYATYCAALLAGYSHEDSLSIAYADQFTDECSRTLLRKLNAPRSAATTQIQTELMNVPTDLIGIQDITRIWASFHFLPHNLSAQLPGRHPRRYMNKYRLICGPNGPLVEETVSLAKGHGLAAAGLAMHILADTWAHANFAGTPANVINNTDSHFYEILEENGYRTERKIVFRHNPAAADDLSSGIYTNSVHQENENSIMNLGHGRAGHLPDYGFVRYKYLPAWGDYRELVKDNPSDYFHAFCQMVTALKFLRGEIDAFQRDTYDELSIAPYADEIRRIICRRQTDSSADWKAFGEKLSGRNVDTYDICRYQQEYLSAAPEEKDGTFLGQFFLAAMAQKSMVTRRIFETGNLLAGISVDYIPGKLRGNRDFQRLIRLIQKEGKNE